jgi:hypothetical protein
MSVELERFRDHARRMAAGRRPARPLQGPEVTLTSEHREQWAALADEADEHLRREAIEEGLFEVEPDPSVDVPLF